jgi:hypothetical protein
LSCQAGGAVWGGAAAAHVRQAPGACRWPETLPCL